MDLKLDSDVVYAILAAIVVIVLIVNATRIIKLRARNRQQPQYQSLTVEQQDTATWPAIPKKPE